MNLSDTHLTVLSAASQRDDRVAIPPERLKGAAAAKLVHALTGRGLIEVVPATPGMPVWRESRDGTHFVLRITDAGLAALGIDPEPKPAAQEPAPKKAPRRAAKTPDAPQVTMPAPAPAAAGADRKTEDRRPCADPKLDRLVEMRRRPAGASIGEAAEALAWHSHAVRGAVAGALKAKRGLAVASEKVDGRGTVYRIAG